MPFTQYLTRPADGKLLISGTGPPRMDNEATRRVLDYRPRQPVVAHGNGQRIGQPTVSHRVRLASAYAPNDFSGELRYIGKRQVFHDNSESFRSPNTKRHRLDAYAAGTSADAAREVVHDVLVDVERFEIDATVDNKMRVRSTSTVPGHESSVSYEPNSTPPVFDVNLCDDVGLLRKKLMEANAANSSMRNNLDVAVSDNNALRSQLEKTMNKVQQLENLVVEKNLRLKQLLSENIQMSAKLKRLQAEFGVDA
ncbi:hypothetical protein AAVH_36160, partial [Aphelenchoides avenae]